MILAIALAAVFTMLPDKSYLMEIIFGALIALQVVCLFVRGLLLTVSTHRRGTLTDYAQAALTPVERYWGRMLPLMIEALPVGLSWLALTAGVWQKDGSPYDGLIPVLCQTFLAWFMYLGALLLGGLWTLLARSPAKALGGWFGFFALYAAVCAPLTFFLIEAYSEHLVAQLDFFTAAWPLWIFSWSLLPGPLIALRLMLGRKGERWRLAIEPILRYAGWWLGVGVAWLVFSVLVLAVSRPFADPDPITPVSPALDVRRECEIYLGQGEDEFFFWKDDSIKVLDLQLNQTAEIPLGGSLQTRDLPTRVFPLTDGTLAVHLYSSLKILDRAGNLTPVIASGRLLFSARGSAGYDMSAPDEIVKFELQVSNSWRGRFDWLGVYDARTWQLKTRFPLVRANWDSVLVPDFQREVVSLWSPRRRSLVRYRLDGSLESKRGLGTPGDWLKHSRLEIPTTDYCKYTCGALDEHATLYLARVTREVRDLVLLIQAVPERGHGRRTYGMQLEKLCQVGTVRVVGGRLYVLLYDESPHYPSRTSVPAHDWRVLAFDLKDMRK